jgi:hypothetical protein
MHRIRLEKPDGRALYLYSQVPLPDGIVAPAPRASGEARAVSSSHLRWHPLRGNG